MSAGRKPFSADPELSGAIDMLNEMQATINGASSVSASVRSQLNGHKGSPTKAAQRETRARRSHHAKQQPPRNLAATAKSNKSDTIEELKNKLQVTEKAMQRLFARTMTLEEQLKAGSKSGTSTGVCTSIRQ